MIGSVLRASACRGNRACRRGAGAVMRLAATLGCALGLAAAVPGTARASAVAVFSLQQTGTNTPGFFAGATLLVTERAYRDGFSFSFRDGEVPQASDDWAAFGLLALDVFARYQDPLSVVPWTGNVLEQMSRLNRKACPSCSWQIGFSLSALPMSLPTGTLQIIDGLADRELSLEFDGRNSGGSYIYDPGRFEGECRAPGSSVANPGFPCTFTADFRFVTLVPEPASLAVLGAGLVALAGLGLCRARTPRRGAAGARS